MIDLAVLFGLVKGKLVVWWHCDFDKYKLLMPIYNVFVRHTLKKSRSDIGVCTGKYRSFEYFM